MPTYGMEEFPELGPAFESSEPRESIYDAAKRVRDECGMNLNDGALERLIDAALVEYHGGNIDAVYP